MAPQSASSSHRVVVGTIECQQQPYSCSRRHEMPEAAIEWQQVLDSGSSNHRQAAGAIDFLMLQPFSDHKHSKIHLSSHCFLFKLQSSFLMAMNVHFSLFWLEAYHNIIQYSIISIYVFVFVSQIIFKKMILFLSIFTFLIFF